MHSTFMLKKKAHKDGYDWVSQLPFTLLTLRQMPNGALDIVHTN